MVGLRLGPTDDGELAAGIAHHHQVDLLFHSAPQFVRHMAGIARALEAEGLNRGAARAVGHLGVELLIDGALAAQGHSQTEYFAALGVLDDEDAGPAPWATSTTEALRRLCARLRSAPLPAAYANPELVSLQLQRILQPRQRLRFSPEQQPLVLKVLSQRQASLDAEVPALLASLQDELATTP